MNLLGKELRPPEEGAEGDDGRASLFDSVTIGLPSFAVMVREAFCVDSKPLLVGIAFPAADTADMMPFESTAQDCGKNGIGVYRYTQGCVVRRTQEQLVWGVSDGKALLLQKERDESQR